jgi:hypothetical protein
MAAIEVETSLRTTIWQLYMAWMEGRGSKIEALSPLAGPDRPRVVRFYRVEEEFLQVLEKGGVLFKLITRGPGGAV